MVLCVSLGTAKYFDSDPIADSMRLRGSVLIEQENWANICALPDQNGMMEYDRYDTPATYYLAKYSDQGHLIATGRLNPTTRPYMLSGPFKELCTKKPVRSVTVIEGSRIVIAPSYTNKQKRRRLSNEILMAYFECAAFMGANALLAFMLPYVWDATFNRIGWRPKWLGPELQLLHSKEILRAGSLPINERVENRIRRNTGLLDPVLDFGRNTSPCYKGAPKITHCKTITFAPPNPPRGDNDDDPLPDPATSFA